MCKPIDCSICEFHILTRLSAGKTWMGCGLHIPYAMSLAPKELWCTCISATGIESEFPPKFGDGMASEEDASSVKIHFKESST